MSTGQKDSFEKEPVSKCHIWLIIALKWKAFVQSRMVLFEKIA